MFSSTMIGSQSFSELMPLDSELVECCSVPLPSLTLRWYRMARGDSSWLFPFFQVSNALLTPPEFRLWFTSFPRGQVSLRRAYSAVF